MESTVDSTASRGWKSLLAAGLRARAQSRFRSLPVVGPISPSEGSMSAVTLRILPALLPRCALPSCNPRVRARREFRKPAAPIDKTAAAGPASSSHLGGRLAALNKGLTEKAARVGDAIFPLGGRARRIQLF